MATTTRYSVAKTQRSYSPDGVAAVKGSTVTSETEEWNTEAYPPSQDTDQLAPTS